MQEQEITGGNKLIAKFMEVRRQLNCYGECVYWLESGYLDYMLKYHSSWEWLMPVVEKIESLNHPVSNLPIEFSLEGKYAAYFNECGLYDYPVSFIRQYADTRQEAVWKAVINFIKWYNSNKNELEKESR